MQDGIRDKILVTRTITLFSKQDLESNPVILIKVAKDACQEIQSDQKEFKPLMA